MPLLLFVFNIFSTAEIPVWEFLAHGAPDEGTAGPRAQYGKCPCFLHLAQKAKTGVSDVERKAGSLLLLLHYTLFWRACRMSIDFLVHRMHGVFFSLFRFVSIARIVIVPHEEMNVAYGDILLYMTRPFLTSCTTFVGLYELYAL